MDWMPVSLIILNKFNSYFYHHHHHDSCQLVELHLSIQFSVHNLYF